MSKKIILTNEEIERDMNILRSCVVTSSLDILKKQDLIGTLYIIEKYIVPKCIICEEISDTLNGDYYCESCQAEYGNEDE